MKHLLENNLRLCLITNMQNRTFDDYTAFIKKAINGGVSMVQLREKGGDINDVKDKALKLQKILKPLNIPLIINDFVELAAEIEADGVHIGQQDMPAFKAREILGPDKIIGMSIESMEELYAANSTKAISYVTASAVFPSVTKPNCKTIWGLKGLAEIAQKSKHPVTAIGGITEKNIQEIIKIPNVYGVAVVSAIDKSICPYSVARNLAKSFEMGCYGESK